MAEETLLTKIESWRLSIAEVEAVLAAPEEQVPAYGARIIYQSRVGRFLVRVVIEQHRNPSEVVTAPAENWRRE